MTERYLEISNLILNDFWECNIPYNNEYCNEGKFIGMKNLKENIDQVLPDSIKLYENDSYKIYVSYKKDERNLLLLKEKNHILFRVKDQKYQIGYFTDFKISWIYQTTLENIIKYLQYLLA